MRPAVLAPRALALLLVLLLPAFYYRRQLSTQYRRLAMTEKDARKLDSLGSTDAGNTHPSSVVHAP